ncbi:MAG: hypothetical protein VXZ55_10355 [Planctomycetota bacterium]|nr:hypothetical protein [Planctomycetota bacterium]
MHSKPALSLSTHGSNGAWKSQVYFTLEVNGNDSVGRKTSGESPEKTNRLVVELSGYLYSWSIT